jgi:hypothetical protein
MLPSRANVGADQFIDSIGEACAETQAGGVSVLEPDALARGQGDGIAFNPRPEVFPKISREALSLMFQI